MKQLVTILMMLVSTIHCFAETQYSVENGRLAATSIVSQDSVRQDSAGVEKKMVAILKETVYGPEVSKGITFSDYEVETLWKGGTVWRKIDMPIYKLIPGVNDNPFRFAYHLFMRFDPMHQDVQIHYVQGAGVVSSFEVPTTRTGWMVSFLAWVLSLFFAIWPWRVFLDTRQLFLKTVFGMMLPSVLILVMIFSEVTVGVLPLSSLWTTSIMLEHLLWVHVLGIPYFLIIFGLLGYDMYEKYYEHKPSFG